MGSLSWMSLISSPLKPHNKKPQKDSQHMLSFNMVVEHDGVGSLAKQLLQVIIPSQCNAIFIPTPGSKNKPECLMPSQS